MDLLVLSHESGKYGSFHEKRFSVKKDNLVSRESLRRKILKISNKSERYWGEKNNNSSWLKKLKEVSLYPTKIGDFMILTV